MAYPKDRSRLGGRDTNRFIASHAGMRARQVGQSRSGAPGGDRLPTQEGPSDPDVPTRIVARTRAGTGPATL